jgi:hypothetical protein
MGLAAVYFTSVASAASVADAFEPDLEGWETLS